jgi:sigma-B regulation protein RsbU (phosphoserine phosphatase)
MADGPMVGVLPMSLAQNQSVPFARGDVLAILTDGFNEAANADGEFFGIERLEQLIEETSELPAQAIGERLHAEVEQFSAPHAQEDDQTLIIVKGI